jgi:hypothetical protein
MHTAGRTWVVPRDGAHTMTSNRRRKAETRAHQAATGVPYI